MSNGCVYLVGAGPGDPDLLTVRAARILEQADVVVYDRLASKEILALAPAAATRVYVGKSPGRHVVPQEQINHMLVDLSRAGGIVIRLKGGDPFIFGRGGEEALHLLEHGIPFEVVPGITAASGCLAAAGIPLTHRGLASGVRFVTGHCRNESELDLDWQGLADSRTTLVLYMGLANLPTICRNLLAAGMDPATPSAAISNGTLPAQKVCRSTLQDLAETVEAARLTSPVLVVIGAVAAIALDRQHSADARGASDVRELTAEICLAGG